jgi:hypothetical protein
MALSYVTLIALTLAYLAGLVVAILLLVKVKGTPAILATVAFGLLFILGLGQIAHAAFLERLVLDQLRPGQARWGIGSLNCCCGTLQLAAIVCLIIAIWQAVSGPKQEGGAPGSPV